MIVEKIVGGWIDLYGKKWSFCPGSPLFLSLPQKNCFLVDFTDFTVAYLKIPPKSKRFRLCCHYTKQSTNIFCLFSVLTKNLSFENKIFAQQFLSGNIVFFEKNLF